MKNFFKIVFASMVGFVLSAIILLFLAVMLIVAMVHSASDDANKEVKTNSVLHITLNYPISERTSKNPFQDFSLSGFDNKTIGLDDILANLRKAKTDKHITGIYLDLSGLEAGLATTEEIRNALIDFKKSGKFIISYSEIYTQGAYYVASVSNKIYINPEGVFEFKGLYSEMTFFKGALDKLGIEAQVIKVGTYKSFAEQYLLDKMSDANKEQVTSYVGSIYDHFLSKISESRNVPKDSLFAIANDLKIQSPADAVKYKLADGLKYKDQILAELKQLSGTEKEKDINDVTIEDYQNSEPDDNTNEDGRIAVVYASGEISGGEGSEETIGSERISRAIRKVRNDSKVKAMVLRINSPGGGTIASEVIWREVVLTQKVKPVIVSMGDMAASGGYYVSCAADSIFAQPNTLTGSIGVFGIIPNFKTFLNDKLGVTFDGVKTGKFSDIQSVVRPLTDAERLIIQNQVNRTYNTFIQHVADGRRKDTEYINSIAQGRVWTGTQAVNNGLVDRIGSIDDAIKSAAKMAKLKNYKVVAYPAIKSPLQSLFDSSGDQIKDYFTKLQLGDQYIYYSQIKNVMQYTGILAKLPYSITIK